MSDELEDVIMGNLKHAMKAKQKFNYFLVGLTFSMLALAIKFQVQTELIVPKIAEIIGCCFLLISGALGFYILRD